MVGSKQRVTLGWRRVPVEFREGGVEEEFGKMLAKSIEKRYRVWGSRRRQAAKVGSSVWTFTYCIVSWTALFKSQDLDRFLSSARFDDALLF